MMPNKKTLAQLSVLASQRVKEKEYWLRKLSDFPGKSRFPLAYNKKSPGEPRLEAASFELSSELSSTLIKLSADSDVRLHIILAAGINALLHRYLDAYNYRQSEIGGQSDIMMGCPILRSEQEANFINLLLVLRTHVQSHMTFKELLLEVRQTVAEALENCNYPVEILAEQLNMPFLPGDEFPLFDIAVLLENIHDKKVLESVHPGMIFSFNREDLSIRGCVEYNSLLYDAAAVEQIAVHFQRLLQHASANPGESIFVLELMSPGEKEQLLIAFNDTRTDYPTGKTIHELFTEQVKVSPDRIAVFSHGRTRTNTDKNIPTAFTYRELNEQSDRLACLLIEKGVLADNIIGIMMGRSIDLVIGIMGILKAGGVYMPIDPEYPQERIDYMLADSGAGILINKSEIRNPKSETNFNGKNIKDQNKNFGDLIILDFEHLNFDIVSNFEFRASNSFSSNLAYIIYTSGSTGKPKGVMVEHRQVVNILFDLFKRFPFGENDTYLLKTPIVFDVSVSELFGWFMGGGRLAILENGAEKDPQKILDTIHRCRISHLNFVPALFNAFVEMLEHDDAGKLSPLKYLFLAGEKLFPGLLKRFQQVSRGNTVVVENLYGPTEGTVYASGYSLMNWHGDSDIPIGKPLGNVKLYILNRSEDLQPIGIPGELYIAGAGVARGYLNKPGLTAEKFINFHHSPFIIHHLNLYRTGDLGRWLPDGNIAFLGRIDHQVKVRGFRIELGEIENRLLNQKKIKEVKVTALRGFTTGEEGEVLLCAYFVAEDYQEKLSIAELREYLTHHLPGYMVPAYFIQLEVMPLTAAGKVDIRALPEPGIGKTEAAYTPPRDAVEKKLVEIWADILNTDAGAIGINDNFFHLGGHSLKATTLVYRIFRELHVNVEISDVFDFPTVKGLAQKVRDVKEVEYDEIEPSEGKVHYPLSFAQRRLWVLCQFEEDSTAYNMPGAAMISGPLEVDSFSRALQALVDRHESLRTVFISVNGAPRQKVLRCLECRLEQTDLLHLDDKAKEEKLRDIFREHSNRPFDLENGPLSRFKLVQWAEEKYLALFNIHHIVSDGWSQGIIFNEVARLYNAFLKNGENPLPPLLLQYKDYTRWHNRLIETGSFNRSREYWLEKFKDKPNGIELPLDHSRKPIQTFNGGRVTFKLGKEKTMQLNRLSLDEGATLFMALLTWLNIFLNRYTSQKDIIIGSPIANRKRPELHNMVGFLVNTLVYRNRVDADKSFRQLLVETKIETLTCYRFQDYPFDLLVEQLGLDRDLSQSPLFNVMLAHNNAETQDTDLQMEGVVISEYSHSNDFNMSKFDLTFFMDESNDDVLTRIEYNSDLFERCSIERMAANFLCLIDHVLLGADIPVSRLKYLSKEEYGKVVREFNETHFPFSPLTLQELFEQRVEICGDKTAVVHNHHGKIENISYGYLNNQANRLAHYLVNKYGVKPNHIIGVSLERSINMIVVLWGIIKAGAAYLAVDPTYPRDRVLHVLGDSRSDLLIIDKMRPDLFGSYEDIILNITQQWPEIQSESQANPGVANSPSDILYVNYTSGSTGTPNGAMLSHDCLTNLIRWQTEKTSIDCSLRCLQFTSINFCVSFQEIMGTLTCGGELYLIGDIERQDIDYLMNFLAEQRIEILFLPFSYLNFLFNESGRWTQGFNHHLKHIITAGEQLKITAGLKRFLDLNPGLRLHNHYGSTEMHVVTSYSLDAATAGRTPIPPVGKPIDNVKIYILDEYYHPVPIGVYGELFVSGSSEVLGYINNEQLNREKLFYHPELSEANKRLYRSGDIGRWSADGNIELRGRKDFQVKIRGFRIEPGEIESKIMAIENIRECVVVVKEDGAHQKYLAAYVSVDNIEISDIKKKIGHDLPQYMIPQLVVLDSLPLMPNGKVDRERLPEPQVEMEATYTGPRDEVESTLAGIWAEILNLPGPSVGIDANFFELGGHSLKATLVMSHIHKRLHKKIPLAEIFKAPTIRELAVYVKGVPVEGYTGIPPALSKDFYVLSPAQKRLFILQQMEKGTINYNLPVIVLLEGKLEEKKLSGIFKRMIARHESFRTSFEVVAGEAVQRIHENVAFEIEYNEYNDSSTGYRDEKNNRLHHSSFIIHHFIRAFDLSKAPLLRIGLLKQEENKHLLLVDMHHIITDGTSLGVFTREFMTLYTGEELPPLRLRYRDYSEWVTGEGQQEIMRRQEEYWLKQFEGDIPVLDLPADYARPTVQSFEGRTMVFEITPFETAQLKKYAHEQNSTLYVMLLAAFGIFIAKLSGQEDIIIGTPTAGRRHADLESIIGMFVNTLALRNFPAGEISFDEYLGDVTRRTWEAFENQDYPFEDLVEKVVQNRNTGRNPLFDVMFVLQNLEISEILIPGLKLSPYRYEIGTAKFDIMLSGVEEGDRLNFGCEYCSKLFKENTIRRFTDFFKKIISIVMGNPCIRLSEIEIISAEEKKQVLIDFNDTIHRYPQDKTIHQLFEEQVEITPDHIAVFSHGRTLSPTNTDNNMSITYRQLNEQSGRLAGLLIEKGVLPDNVVGLMIDRSIEMMVGLLGILKSGGAYLPIAPEYPKERIDYMLKDSHAKVLIINKSEIRNPKLETNSNKTNSNEPNKNFEDMMVLDFKHLNLISQKECPRRGLHHPNHLAYIIYTSGSTGKPKGVMVQKEGFLNLLRWYIKELDITEADNHLLIAPISFDLAQKNLFSPFLVGGRLTLAAPGILDYRELAGTIHKEHITMINCAPSVFYPLIEMNHDGSFTRLQSLRAIILGGEPIRFDRLLPWVNSDGFHCEILNTYGPTECTDIATCYRIPGKSVYSPGTIPIGRPIYNVRVYVLDKYLQVLPVKIPGELCIGGIGLAQGYYNNKQLSEQKFIVVPHLPEKKVYRTGDLCRWLPDGNIEFLARIDHQVKMRGFRIELGEIENELLKHEEIKEAVVIARQDETGERGEYGENYLCAYIVPRAKQRVDISALREYLGHRLPDYMVPAYFVYLEVMPLTPSGKINRRGLPEPELKMEKNYAAPRDHIEEALVKIWHEVLDNKALSVPGGTIGIDDNFFQLGGHSLKAAIMTAKVHKALHMEIPLGRVFETPTIRALSGYIKETKKKGYEPIESVLEREYYALSSAQKRLYILQQMELGSTVYNMPITMRLLGELDAGKLERIFSELITRHESLRTSFETVGDRPMQHIHTKVDFKIEYYGVDSAGRFDISHFVKVFDLSRPPLLRVGLIKTGANEHILLVDMHHIIADGTSLSIFSEEMMALYQGNKLPSLKITYKDYAAWQNSQKNKEIFSYREKFWLEQFDGEMPVLNLPTDYSRPVMQSFAGNRVDFELNRQETGLLKKLAQSQGATIYMTILAACNTWLAKLSGEEDIIIGTPIAGRDREEFQGIIGMFVNTLPLRNYPEPGKIFVDFLTEIKERTLAALENQDYQFEDLVEKIVLSRDTSRNPVFDVMFVFQNMEMPVIDVPGLTLKPNEYEIKTAKFDLNLVGVEIDDRLTFSLEYSTSLFKEKTIRDFIGYFQNIIRSVSANPAVKLAEIEIIDQEQKKRILEISNGITDSIDLNETIHGRFEKIVLENEHKTALVFRDGQITYGKLNRKANRLARLLQIKGVGRDKVVGLMVERSFEMVIGMIGIMKAGGAYLPIDTKLPGLRKRFMIEDGNISALVTNFDIEENADYIPRHIEPLDIRNEYFYQGTGENLPPANKGADLVYVLFTSGSTGKPKGVMLEHTNLVNLIIFHHKYTNIDCSKVLQFATISFDASFHEIFSALLAGGELYLIPEETRNHIPELFRLINKNKIKTLFLPMSFIKLIFSQDDYIDIFPGSVTHIQTAGEQVVVDDRSRNYLKQHHIYLHNHYGPSETHVVTTLTMNPTENIPEFPSIGKPIMNTGIYILDKGKQLLPIGIAGELYAGGLQVGRGYLNKPEITNDKFKIKNVSGALRANFHHSPFSIHHANSYNTGDLARWLVDGNIEFLGRIDHQVKIRGIRVEPGEIENQLKKIAFIKEAVVIVKQSETGDKYLCAYLVVANARELDISKLRNILAVDLPDYMIPAYFVPVDKIPLTPSGKVDRKALPATELKEGKDYIAPRDEIEKKLVEIWSEILGMAKELIGSGDNFFHLGGHSLKAINMINKIHKHFGVKVALQDVFRNSNIAALSRIIKKSNARGFKNIEKQEKKEYYELSYAQKRLWYIGKTGTESLLFNMPGRVTIYEALDEKTVRMALEQLTARHESLRTYFREIKKEPVQVVESMDRLTIHLEIADLSDLTGLELEKKRQDLYLEESVYNFNLEQPPLSRVKLIKCTAAEYDLVFNMHHIISDGWSLEILKQEFRQLVDAYKNGTSPSVGPTEFQYTDYAAWQNRLLADEKQLGKAQEFWREQLNRNLPVLNLPYDFSGFSCLSPNSPSNSPNANSNRKESAGYRWVIPGDLANRLRSMAEERRASLFMILLAGFNLLMAKVTNQEEIIMAIPAAARQHEDLKNIIGLFVNTLILCNRVATAEPFPVFFDRLQENTFNVLEYQGIPLESICGQLKIKYPEISVFFNMINTGMTQQQNLGNFDSYHLGKVQDAKFEIVCYLTEYKNGIEIDCHYYKNRFKAVTIEKLMQQYNEILVSITGNSSRNVGEYFKSGKKRKLKRIGDLTTMIEK